jgi:hypothetical protein
VARSGFKSAAVLAWQRQPLMGRIKVIWYMLCGEAQVHKPVVFGHAVF